MSRTSEDLIQEGILTLLDTLPQPVVEQAIPNSETVIRNAAGEIEPYYAIQFGDSREEGANSMIGPLGDDYGIPIYIQAVGPQAKIVRQMGNRVRWLLLSKSFDWSGQIRKRPGGGMFPIVSSNAATEAYQMPASFFIPFQYAEVT